MAAVYPKPTAICILCDGGGSNSASHHIFKQELLKLATSLELDIIIAHYPPYCSKYNPIEHKLFAHITRSWSGVPLLSAEYACRKANETTTSKGFVLLPPSILRNTKLKERLTNHMYPKDKSESDLINNCLSGTMSLGANLLSIFVPSYFLTVTYSNDYQTNYFYSRYHIVCVRDYLIEKRAYPSIRHLRNYLLNLNL